MAITEKKEEIIPSPFSQKISDLSTFKKKDVMKWTAISNSNDGGSARQRLSGLAGLNNKMKLPRSKKVKNGKSS
jgi:hypothetical protein